MSTSYDYTKTNNLFNINNLYRKILVKPFIKGKKKQLGILMIYEWLIHFNGGKNILIKI